MGTSLLSITALQKLLRGKHSKSWWGSTGQADELLLNFEFIMNNQEQILWYCLRQYAKQAFHQTKAFLLRSPYKQLMKQKHSKDSLTEHI